jgi:hypothetical protein
MGLFELVFGTKRGKKLTSLMPSSNGLCALRKFVEGKRISLERLLSEKKKHPDFSFKVPRCP